jgi:hypothetical protein
MSYKNRWVEDIDVSALAIGILIPYINHGERPKTAIKVSDFMNVKRAQRE